VKTMRNLAGLFFLLAFVFFTPVNAQDNHVNVLGVTVDGMEVEKYSVVFVVNGKEIVPPRDGNKIIIPKEVSEADKVTVSITVLSYTLTFSSIISLDEVKADIIVGVDTRPFEQRNVPKKDAGKYQYIYYIETVPRPTPDPYFIQDGIRFIFRVPLSVSNKACKRLPPSQLVSHSTLF
jgi:hypothetical protein